MRFKCLAVGMFLFGIAILNGYEAHTHRGSALRSSADIVVAVVAFGAAVVMVYLAAKGPAVVGSTQETQTMAIWNWIAIGLGVALGLAFVVSWIYH